MLQIHWVFKESSVETDGASQCEARVKVESINGVNDEFENGGSF